jgi:hypothetical protein
MTEDRITCSGLQSNAVCGITVHSAADNVPCCCCCCSRVTEYVAWINERDERAIRENERKEINFARGIRERMNWCGRLRHERNHAP